MPDDLPIQAPVSPAQHGGAAAPADQLHERRAAEVRGESGDHLPGSLNVWPRSQDRG